VPDSESVTQAQPGLAGPGARAGKSGGNDRELDSELGPSSSTSNNFGTSRFRRLGVNLNSYSGPGFVTSDCQLVVLE
jgi:hypothetical protein